MAGIYHQAGCCCGALCCHCGDCCYSTTSKMGNTWAWDQPAEYAAWTQAKKDAFDVLATGTLTGAGISNLSGQPPVDCPLDDFITWQATSPVPSDVVRYCSSNSWHVVIGDMFAAFVVTGAGTCCGITAASGTFAWYNPPTFEYEEAPVSGSLAMTISNNRCCHEDDADECHKTAADNCPDDDDCDLLEFP